MHEVTTVLILMCPDIVFLIFLPPLLYAAAWQTPFHDFRENLRPIALSGNGPSSSQQEMDARLALLASANMYLDDRKSQGFPENEIDYLRSHFRAQADSWLTRLDLDDVSLLESQSPVCHRAFTGVLTAQRHRLHELVRPSIIEESLVQK